METGERDLQEMDSMALIHYANEALEKEPSIEELEVLREEMLLRRFNAPFRALLRITKEELGENSAEEIADLKKQVSFFRYVAMLKKSTLARVRVAVSAKKIKQNIPYEDFANYLPTNGNYIENLVRSGAYGIMVFRELEDAANPFFKSTSVKKALLSSIVLYAAEGVREEVLQNEADAEVAEYNYILRKHNITPYSRVEHLEGFEGLKKELEERGFLENAKMREEFANKIEERKKTIRNEIRKRSFLLTFIPIIKFYLRETRESAKRNKIYPALVSEPDEKTLSNLVLIKEYTGMDFAKIIRERMMFYEYNVGAAIVAKEKGIEWASEFLKISPDEVKKQIELYEALKGGRGREFLEKIGNSGKKNGNNGKD
ncbi:MAG: DUF530 family protein [Candidatus Anstonellales archaeon]